MTGRSLYLTAALEVLDEALVMLDESDRIVDLSPAAEHLLGCSPQDVCDSPASEVVRFLHDDGEHPDGMPRVLLGADGSRRMVTVVTVDVPGGGTVIVLKPWKAPDAEVWQRLLAHSHYLACIADTEGYLQQANHGWTEVLGYTPEELLGRRFTEFVHPDDLKRSVREGRRMLATGNETLAFENRYRCKDGGYRWLSWYATTNRATCTTYAVARDITDVRRQQRLLRETQATARIGGWELEVASGSLYWSEEVYSLHNTTPTEYTPTIESSLAYYAAENRAVLTKAIETAVEHGEPFDLTLELVTSAGPRRWCRMIGRASKENHKVVRVYGSIQDISTQHQVEEALRAGEHQLRSLVRDVKVGLVLHGPNAEVLRCNQAALDALGLTEDQLLGRSAFDDEWNIIHEDGTIFRNIDLPVPQAIATGTSVTDVIMGVYRPRTKDRVWLLVNAVVQNDDDGKIRTVVCSFFDITARKRAEDVAQQSYAMFRAVYDNAGLGVILRTPNDQVIDCNPTFERMLGHSVDVLTGMDPDQYIHQNDQGPPADQHAALLAGECTSYEFERCYVRADGETLWGHATVSMVRDDSDAPRYLVEMVHDITDRKQIEAQLLLADRLASLGTMAAGVAHEINNPLTWIMGNAKFVLECMEEDALESADEELVDELQQAIRDVRTGATRIQTVVKDLKTFSRIEESPENAINLAEVISSAVRMLRNELNYRAKLVLELADEVPPVFGDKARLGQVLTNLLLNAIQAMPERHREHNKIRVRAWAHNGEVALVVSDNGMGIPPEAQARVFDPFFTTKNTGEGTGLGLSICHTIVTRMGGRITLDSEPGVGTSVSMWLRPATPDKVIATTPPPITVGGTPKRILFIDDEPGVGKAIERWLRGYHEVTVETDGARALARIRVGERYDAVICDIIMPSMSGMEFYRELCALTPELAQRCGFVTGGAFAPAAREFVAQLPAFRLLEKPFERDTVRLFLDRLLT